jgi:hypothetical protein
MDLGDIGLTPKYQRVLYIDVRVVRDSGWASSAASMGAELDAMVIPRPIRNREAMYMGAANSVSLHLTRVPGKTDC